MTDMIERVARAICRNQPGGCAGGCRDRGEPCRARSEILLHDSNPIAAQARAAIAAMREPTEAMVEAGGLEVFSCSDDDPSAEKAAAAWPAMIDAALEPPNGPARRDPAQDGHPATPEAGTTVTGL